MSKRSEQRSPCHAVMGQNACRHRDKSISAYSNATAVEVPNGGQWVLMWLEQVLLTLEALVKKSGASPSRLPHCGSDVQQRREAPFLPDPDPDPSGAGVFSTCVTPTTPPPLPPRTPRSQINRQGCPSAKENIILFSKNPVREIWSHLMVRHNVSM